MRPSCTTLRCFLIDRKTWCPAAMPSIQRHHGRSRPLSPRKPWILPDTLCCPHSPAYRLRREPTNSPPRSRFSQKAVERTKALQPRRPLPPPIRHHRHPLATPPSFLHIMAHCLCLPLPLPGRDGA